MPLQKSSRSSKSCIYKQIYSIYICVYISIYIKAIFSFSSSAFHKRFKKKRIQQKLHQILWFSPFKTSRCAMAAVRKRKRITPTLLTAPSGDAGPDGDPSAQAAPAVVKFSTSQELEVVSKAVKQLQPLKAGGNHPS